MKCDACGSRLERGNENFCPYCGKPLSKSHSLTLEYSLPINAQYSEVIPIKEIQNKSVVRISNATLGFYPYYLFEYKVQVRRKDPLGKSHSIKNEGKHIVNAHTEELLSMTPTTQFKNLFSRFVSHREESELDVTEPTEKNQIMRDLENIIPNYSQTFNPTSEYRIDVVPNKVTLNESEKVVLRKIREENTTEAYYVKKDKKREKMKITPTYNEIKFKQQHMIYVPVWTINYKSGRKSYLRRCLAASGIIVLDEIAYCPKHFAFGKIINLRKKTYAVCDTCGGAFCIDHITKVNESYCCEDHTAGI